MPDQTFLLPAQLRNAVGAYLAQRPYAEVAGLIQALGQLRASDGGAAAGEAQGGPASQREGQLQPDISAHYAG